MFLKPNKYKNRIVKKIKRCANFSKLIIKILEFVTLQCQILLYLKVVSEKRIVVQRILSLRCQISLRFSWNYFRLVHSFPLRIAAKAYKIYIIAFDNLRTTTAFEIYFQSNSGFLLLLLGSE